MWWIALFAGTVLGQACPVGQYLVGNSSCAPCALGSYTDITTATVCTSCAVGTFASTTASTTCYLCPVGRVTGSTMSQSCWVCGPGTFAPIEGSSSCLLCDVGTFAHNPGSQNCSLCDPGKYAVAAAQNCSLCVLGRFSTTGASGCPLCVEGTFAANIGSPTCTLCPPGRFASGLAATECFDCDVNTFASLGGSSVCSACTSNTITASTGATTCYPNFTVTQLVTTVTVVVDSTCAELVTFANSLRTELARTLSVNESDITIQAAGCVIPPGRRLLTSTVLTIIINTNAANAQNDLSTTQAYLRSQEFEVVANSTLNVTGQSFIGETTVDVNEPCSGFSCPPTFVRHSNVICSGQCSQDVCCDSLAPTSTSSPAPSPVPVCNVSFAAFTAACGCPASMTAVSQCPELCSQHQSSTNCQAKVVSLNCTIDIALGTIITAVRARVETCAPVNGVSQASYSAVSLFLIAAFF